MSTGIMILFLEHSLLHVLGIVFRNSFQAKEYVCTVIFYGS